MFDLIKLLVGLLFPYLVLSLICMLIVEFFVRATRLRAKLLWRSIDVMLADPPHKALTSDFYGSPLIVALRHGGFGSPPSYISSYLFASALVDVVKRKSETEDTSAAFTKIGSQPLARAIFALTPKNASPEAIFESIQLWYNEVMERTSGWYQEKVQSIVILSAFVLAVGFNIDTVLLSDYLTRGAVLREVFVARAAKEIQTPPADSAQQPLASNRAKTLAEEWYELQPFGLPIGWNRQVGWNHQVRGTPSWPKEETILMKVIGLVLTACAIILGAPVWFDVLTRFVNVRTSGRAPEEVPPAPRPWPPPSRD
jgi:hypothetical protein